MNPLTLAQRLEHLNVRIADLELWTERAAYDFVIVAVGFDALSFSDLFDDETRAQVVSQLGGWGAQHLEELIQHDLSTGGLRPRLHLPMLAGVAQGPGFPNLSCLGLGSDRILSSYVGQLAPGPVVATAEVMGAS